VIAHGGIWVEPTLLAEIEYRAKSAEGKGAASRQREMKEAANEAALFIDLSKIEQARLPDGAILRPWP